MKKMNRKESCTYTEFFAVCGGLLGLFLGGSVLSIIELIYFFTLRLFFNVRKSKTFRNTVTPIDHKVESATSCVRSAGKRF